MAGDIIWSGIPETLIRRIRSRAMRSCTTAAEARLSRSIGVESSDILAVAACLNSKLCCVLLSVTYKPRGLAAEVVLREQASEQLFCSGPVFAED